MEEKTYLLRGARVLQFLAEDSTTPELERNIVVAFPLTTKRQHATDPVRVSQVKYTPLVARTSAPTSAPAGTSMEAKLKVSAVATNGGKTYDPVIQFNTVEYQENDLPTNVTFVAVNRETYNIMPIPLSKHTVRVRCTCLDFYYRFSLWNFNDNSMYGRRPPKYVKKTNRPPVNPDKLPGVCKHLIKTFIALRDAGIIVP